jgi:hypothetical protein
LRPCKRCYYDNVLPRHWCGDCDKVNWDKNLPEYTCAKHPDREAVGAVSQVLMCRECFNEEKKKWTEEKRKKQKIESLDKYFEVKRK